MSVDPELPATDARVAWNALTPRRTTPIELTSTTRQLSLKGTATQLQPGDGILLLDEERESDKGSERWRFRFLES